MTDRPNKNVERGRATREQIVAVATRLFAARGYEGTSIDAVLQGAAVSRGSLYHHFAGKDALFEAVLADVEARVGDQVLAAAESAAVQSAAAGGAMDPVAALRAAALAWIKLAGDPVVKRILLIDAPAVLGWERWRAMDEANYLGQVKAALQEVADVGRLRQDLVDMFAHVLMASMNEVALMVARADDPDAVMEEAASAIEALLQRLLVP